MLRLIEATLVKLLSLALTLWIGASLLLGHAL